MVFYFFPEGVIQFLDAGRLDLGVVRDSTLDATNDYEKFVEGIANRGYANSALQLVMENFCPTGASGRVGAKQGALLIGASGQQKAPRGRGLSASRWRNAVQSMTTQ